MRRLAILSALILACAAAPARATPLTEKLTACVTSSATTEDRTAIMVFVFAAISRHPAAEPYARFSAEDRRKVARAAAMAMQRLVTVDCRAESVAVLQNEPDGFITAFEALGEVAATDLMGSPQVAKELDGLVDYFDPGALESLGEAAAGEQGPGRKGKAPI